VGAVIYMEALTTYLRAQFKTVDQSWLAHTGCARSSSGDTHGVVRVEHRAIDGADGRVDPRNGDFCRTGQSSGSAQKAADAVGVAPSVVKLARAEEYRVKGVLGAVECLQAWGKHGGRGAVSAVRRPHRHARLIAD
jgi:hypothetical protein